jgi:hypothetical protein
MHSIAQALQARLGLVLQNCSDSRVEDHGWDILFDYHSRFDGLDLKRLSGRALGVQLVRDPRMVLVSGAKYHLKSDEAWLHVPREQFAGLTYQEKIRSLENDKDRFLFEMDHVGGVTIREMIDWQDHGYPWCRTFKLEELMTDVGLDRFFSMFRFLGFESLPLVTCLDVAYRKSVFGGAQSATGHIRSRTPEDWKQYFDDELCERFDAIFPGSVEKLGYQF